MSDKLISVLAMDHFFDAVIKNRPAPINIIYPEDIDANIMSIHGILTTPWSKVDSTLINRLPNLKIISCFGTGIDSVDKIAALQNNIIITNTPDVVTEDTADIAMALLLCLSRHIVFNDKYARAGKWKSSPAPLGTSVFGKTLGIVGLGKIGSRIADRAVAFGLNVIYHSRTKKSAPFHYYDSLIEMAKQTDFLIVCCPGGNETKNLINLDVLTALGTKGYLINVSRGSTVNESDLIHTLENNLIAGAGLDVYINEPNIPEALTQMDQVVLLPHIGTATKETRKKMLMLAINNIQSFLESGKALTPVN